MRIPRDVSGEDLVKKLKKLGYTVDRQTGSHLRLTTSEHGEHHITIPAHKALRIGTLSSILIAVANHFEVSKEEILKQLF